MSRLITDILQIKYPILQGGMAWISEAELAAAVSNAGGAGIISAAARSPEYVRAEIKKARKLTNQPFGVNIMLKSNDIEHIIEVVCEEKPAFVTLGAGNPLPYFSDLHSAGVKVIPVIPNVRLAVKVFERGADAVVAEGMESGGHIGQETTMSLLEQVIPAVPDKAVLGAGGIADGRAVAATLLMGAAGVQLGTRFLLAEECHVHENMKQKLLAAQDTDSIVTGLTLGSSVRGLKNKFSTHFWEAECAHSLSKEELLRLAVGTNRLAAVDGDVENGMVLAGQTLCPLNRIMPTKDIIEELMQETVDVLQKATDILTSLHHNE